MQPRIKDFINRGIMPLVGRDRELHTLREAFNGLLEGEPRAVWMSGPAGVGKSRLLDELKGEARDHAARSIVIHAKWYEGEGVEFGPLSNALEVLRPAIAAPIATRIYREGAVVTVDAAVEAVQVVSRRYPVVLIFDDLHYLDTSSELERFIAALEEIPILLIATTRPVENRALRSLRQALAGSIPPLELEIGPLDGAGIAEAARVLFGQDPPEEIIGQIAALSAGVPLALREVFRELMAGDVIVQGEGGSGWRWHVEVLDDERLHQIGEQVHGFSGRLASLPERQRQLLALSAYLGEQFNRDVLRQLAERTIGWDDMAFERLILSGFVSVATPSIRLGTGEQEGRVCYAFTHTLLWKAAGESDAIELPDRETLAAMTLNILAGGTGELYSVAPLEKLKASELGEEHIGKLFDWLIAVGRKLPPLYSEIYTALCRAALEPFRHETGKMFQGGLQQAYLASLSIYGERLYLTGAKETLSDVADEIAALLETLVQDEQAPAEERMIRLDAAVVVWHNALLKGDPGSAKGYLDEMLNVLPAPEELTDRELRGAAEAIRLRALYAFERGEFARMLDLAVPYISEMDRMQPETLNALLKVLLYPMIQAGRMREAGEMVEAGLRLRHEADLFSEYELLMHAANYARQRQDLEKVRTYASELRTLIDRYPAYRNLSTNYWHLPYVAAREGKPEELEELERVFRATPPPARSSEVQTAIAVHQFQCAWNLLREPEASLRFAGEIKRELLSPLHQVRIVQEELRSRIDLRAREDTASLLDSLERLTGQVHDDFADPESESGRRLTILRAIAAAIADEEAITTLCELAEGCKPEHYDDTDAFRAARLLLETAEQSPGRKRELNDAAYSMLEAGIGRALEEGSPALAHYMLDTLKDLLPKTRLSRFRQTIGSDPRGEQSETGEREDTAEALITGSSGTMLRAFGALRLEGAEETGTKLESKTRTLVAALVVAKLGDTRWIGELTRDRLADLLWPDMSLDRAVNNLHATLSYARRFLGGAETVIQRDGVYELGDSVLIDAVVVRENVRKANRLYNEGVYFGAAVAYRAAVDLADADFLEGMYAEWIDAMRESLRGEVATALERLIGIEIDRENYLAVPSLAERLLALDDLHDGAYEALIRSAATRGARREAFTYYKRYESALDAYGAGPTRRITELIEKVRSGEI